MIISPEISSRVLCVVTAVWEKWTRRQVKHCYIYAHEWIICYVIVKCKLKHNAYRLMYIYAFYFVGKMVDYHLLQSQAADETARHSIRGYGVRF